MLSFSQKLQLTEDVAGASFMAAGSSAPELFTSIIGRYQFINHNNNIHSSGKIVFTFSSAESYFLGCLGKEFHALFHGLILLHKKKKRIRT